MTLNRLPGVPALDVLSVTTDSLHVTTEFVALINNGHTMLTMKSGSVPEEKTVLPRHCSHSPHLPGST